MINNSLDITLRACPPRQQEAEKIAQRYNFPLSTGRSTGRYCLYLSPERLELNDLTNKSIGPIFIDFVAGRAHHRRLFGGGKKQSLARAIGIKGIQMPEVLDATTGFARDAFVLASLGCNITMVERSPVIAALLEDAIYRASMNQQIQKIAARMTLRFEDSIQYIESLTAVEKPDTIFLDPMYPHRNKSALAKKEMIVARELVGDDEDAGVLLQQALKKAAKRVVVKRPRLAPTVDETTPDTAIYSKNTRYDLYTTKRLSLSTS